MRWGRQLPRPAVAAAPAPTAGPGPERQRSGCARPETRPRRPRPPAARRSRGGMRPTAAAARRPEWWPHARPVREPRSPSRGCGVRGMRAPSGRRPPGPPPSRSSRSCGCAAGPGCRARAAGPMPSRSASCRVLLGSVALRVRRSLQNPMQTATAPTTITAGEATPPASARSAMSAKVPTVVRCCSVVPRSTMRDGVDAGRPAATRAPPMSQLRHSHEQDERALDPRIRRPVDLVVVRRDDSEAAGQPAVRDRDAGGGRHRDRGRHTGHDLHRDAGGDARDASSPPRPSTYGSPPLSRTTRLPARARCDQESLIWSCGKVMRGGDLPASMTSTSSSSSSNSAARTESVDDDDVRLGEQPTTADGDESGVTGAAADQRDPAGETPASAAGPGACLASEQQLRLRRVAPSPAARVASAGHGDGTSPCLATAGVQADDAPRRRRGRTRSRAASAVDGHERRQPRARRSRCAPARRPSTSPTSYSRRCQTRAPAPRARTTSSSRTARPLRPGAGVTRSRARRAATGPPPTTSTRRPGRSRTTG